MTKAKDANGLITEDVYKRQAMDFDITETMNSWITGKTPQAGFVIKADQEPGADTPQELRVPGEILYNSCLLYTSRCV